MPGSLRSAPSRERAKRAPASVATLTASLRDGAGRGAVRRRVRVRVRVKGSRARPARSPPSLAPPRVLTRPGRGLRGSAGRSTGVAAAAAGAGSCGDGRLGFVWLGGVPSTDGLRWPRSRPALGQAGEDMLYGERAGSPGVPAVRRAACSRHARGRPAREAEYIHRGAGSAVIPRLGAAAFARANPVASPQRANPLPRRGSSTGDCTASFATSRVGGEGRSPPFISSMAQSPARRDARTLETSNSQGPCHLSAPGFPRSVATHETGDSWNEDF